MAQTCTRCSTPLDRPTRRDSCPRCAEEARSYAAFAGQPERVEAEVPKRWAEPRFAFYPSVPGACLADIIKDARRHGYLIEL